MGAAVKIRDALSPVLPADPIIDEVVRALPDYFDLDLHVALRFDISRPFVRLAHLLTSPFLRRLQGVQPHAVFIVFGYAIERLIGFSVTGFDPETALEVSKRLRSFQELEKGTRCLNLGKSLERQLAQSIDGAGAEDFPVGRVIFESSDGHQRFVVDGLALQHVAESLKRAQGIAGQSRCYDESAHDPYREASLDYLKCLAFDSRLQDYHLLSSSGQDVDQTRIFRFRVIRHLYRFLMHHAKPQPHAQDGWMRRLMFDVASYTRWSAFDMVEEPATMGTGMLSVVQKKNFCCDI
jgi:hypothetical protein